MARKYSLKDSVAALFCGVFCLSLIILASHYATRDYEKRMTRQTVSWLPFQTTKITRGDHSVLHVIGNREQVQSVIAANPDVDQVVSVQPTKKSIRQIHTEKGEWIKSELRDMSTAIRSVRQR